MSKIQCIYNIFFNVIDPNAQNTILILPVKKFTKPDYDLKKFTWIATHWYVSGHDILALVRHVDAFAMLLLIWNCFK